MKTPALVSAPLAPVALIGGWVVAAAVQPGGFDSVGDTISALAAEGTPYREVMTAGLAVLGVAHVVTAWSLDEARPVGRVVLAAGGVAALLVAVFAIPSPAHAVVATASFVLLTLWPAASGLPSRRVSWLATGVLTVLLVWFGLELNGPRVGLAERALAGAQALWPLVVVVGLARRRESDRTQETPRS